MHSERERYHLGQVAQAERDYASHELAWVERAGHGVVVYSLRRPDSSAFGAVFALLPFKTLMMAGDGPDIFMRRGQGSGPGDLRVHHAAASEVGYLAGKVALVDGEHAHCWDSTVALDELQREIAGAVADGDQAIADQLRLVAGDVGADPSQIDFWQAMHDHVQDAHEYTFGEVINPDVYRLHAALQRLSAWLLLSDVARAAESV